MKRLKGPIMAAVLALVFHGGAQAGPLILATSVQGGNCTVTVALNSLTASFFSGMLTYTFVPVSGGANIAFPPPQATLSFPVPGGSYTLWITVGPYSGLFGQTSSAGYPVTVTPCPLSNTGVGDNCSTLKPGDIDPHWQQAYPYPFDPSGTTPVADDPSNPVGAWVPVYANSPDPAWLGPNAASTWITPTPASPPAAQSGGEYVYRTTFSPPGSATSISGWYWSDNELVGVYLNGVQQMSFPLNGPADFLTPPTAFTVAGLGAVNTLDFVVRNRGVGGVDSQPTVTGLRVEFRANGCQRILPQFAFGGGWYTALYFTNTTSVGVSFPVSFTADGGTPLIVPSLGGSSTTVTLSPQGTAVVEAPDTGSLNQGYVSAPLPNGVVGYGVFRSDNPGPGLAAQEAVVPLSLTGTSAATLIYDDTTYITAVAITNLSNLAESVAITVLDSTGALVGNSQVSLPPNGKTEALLRTLPGLQGMAGNRGSASFTVTTGGSVAVLGLRANGAALTSIPVAAQ